MDEIVTGDRTDGGQIMDIYHFKSFSKNDSSMHYTKHEIISLNFENHHHWCKMAKIIADIIHAV